MTEIIKGGAYQRSDGTWINAKGKPIAAPSGNVYKQEAEEVIPQAPGGADEFGAPVEPIQEGDVKKAKALKTTKKTGGD